MRNPSVWSAAALCSHIMVDITEACGVRVSRLRAETTQPNFRKKKAPRKNLKKDQTDPQDRKRIRSSIVIPRDLEEPNCLVLLPGGIISAGTGAVAGNWSRQMKRNRFSSVQDRVEAQIRSESGQSAQGQSREQVAGNSHQSASA